MARYLDDEDDPKPEPEPEPEPEEEDDPEFDEAATRVWGDESWKD